MRQSGETESLTQQSVSRPAKRRKSHLKAIAGLIVQAPTRTAVPSSQARPQSRMAPSTGRSARPFSVRR